MLTNVDATPARLTVRIGAFVFDQATGEIRGPGSQGTSGTRLAPQPAKLLQLLIAKEGALLTHAEIRDALWPDTHIEFDQSLRFCIRQIRAAFNDSAGAPTYIETLPKRGYRLLQVAEALHSEPSDPEPQSRARHQPGALQDESAVSPPSTEPGPPSSRLRSPAASAVLFGLAAAAVVVAWFLIQTLGFDRSGASPKRLAIMPFELATDEPVSQDLARLTEGLLAQLANQGGDHLEVIGPRTTAPYSAFPFPQMRRLKAELSIDYVLNARYLKANEEGANGDASFLVELIRLSDGAHPWVQLFEDTRSWSDIESEVATGVIEALQLSS